MQEIEKGVKTQIDMMALLGAEGLIGTRRLSKRPPHPTDHAKEAYKRRCEKKDKKRRRIAAKSRKTNRRG